MIPTWDSLAPILRGADPDEEAAWQVLLAHAEFLQGSVRRVVARAHDVVATFDGRADATTAEAFQWVAERLVRRITTEPTGLPVSERADGSRGSAPRWFFTVGANLARDWLKAQRRRLHREVALPERTTAAPEAPEALHWDDAALRKLQRLLERPDRAGVPETHVLAYLCLYRPDVVDRGAVERAHRYQPTAGSRSGQPGLLREPAEAWPLFQGWRKRHGDDPFTAQARTELAWVLRSTDPGPPDTWRDRDPKAVRTATVTLGKWAIRCADVLTLPRR
ncbi:MAG: hypothetical protein H6732_10545 [Alphaproteobacteria bacterium]|nr:hypothetical protein [Alphaproteobacteria bacterium]